MKKKLILIIIAFATTAVYSSEQEAGKETINVETAKEQKLEILADAFTKPFLENEDLAGFPDEIIIELYNQLKLSIYNLLTEVLDDNDIDVMYNYYSSNANQKMLASNRLDNIYSNMQNKISVIKKNLTVIVSRQI